MEDLLARIVSAQTTQKDKEKEGGHEKHILVGHVVGQCGGHCEQQTQEDHFRQVVGGLLAESDRHTH